MARVAARFIRYSHSSIHPFFTIADPLLIAMTLRHRVPSPHKNQARRIVQHRDVDAKFTLKLGIWLHNSDREQTLVKNNTQSKRPWNDAGFEILATEHRFQSARHKKIYKTSRLFFSLSPSERLLEILSRFGVFRLLPTPPRFDKDDHLTGERLRS